MNEGWLNEIFFILSSLRIANILKRTPDQCLRDNTGKLSVCCN